MIRHHAHGIPYLIRRNHADEIRCFVSVPRHHALHGNTSLAELNLVLDVPLGVTYSAGGSLGWWIGFAGGEDWAIAELRCRSVCRQLSEFGSRPRLDVVGGPTGPGVYSMRLA